MILLIGALAAACNGNPASPTSTSPVAHTCQPVTVTVAHTNHVRIGWAGHRNRADLEHRRSRRAWSR